MNPCCRACGAARALQVLRPEGHPPECAHRGASKCTFCGERTVLVAATERAGSGPCSLGGSPGAGFGGPPEARPVWLAWVSLPSRPWLRFVVAGSAPALARLVAEDEVRYARRATVSQTGEPPGEGSRPSPRVNRPPTVPGSEARVRLPMPGLLACEHCGEPCGMVRSGPGRPRRYCSERCRKAHGRAVAFRAAR